MMPTFSQQQQRQQRPFQLSPRQLAAHGVACVVFGSSTDVAESNASSLGASNTATVKIVVTYIVSEGFHLLGQIKKPIAGCSELLFMQLANWARQQGLSYRTAGNMFKQGTLPVPAIQLATATIILQTDQPAPLQGVALYARVSSSDQKTDLQAQLGRLRAYAASEHLPVTRTYTETGSGLMVTAPNCWRCWQTRR